MKKQHILWILVLVLGGLAVVSYPYLQTILSGEVRFGPPIIESVPLFGNLPNEKIYLTYGLLGNAFFGKESMPRTLADGQFVGNINTRYI